MSAANQKIYDNAPIIEAVIDFRTPISASNPVSNFKDALISSLPEYRLEQDINHGNVNVEFGADGIPSAQTTTDHIGCSFRSLDEKRIVQFKKDGLASSRLSPYKDWEDTYSETKRLWGIHKRIMLPQSVDRIALRYINRIDLPLGLSTAQLHEYFRIAPAVSTELIPVGVPTYLMQLIIPLPNLNGKAIINQGTAQQFRADKQSIMLDIDVFVEQVVDANSEEVWTILGNIREEKNRIFEACITDKLRELIK